MTNKIFKYGAGMAAIFALAACSNEAPEQNGASGEGVTFTVNLPKEMGTRAAFGDGLQADMLYYAVYDDKGNYVLDSSKSFSGAISTTVSIPLANGMTYSVAFFACETAEGTDAPYTFDAQAGTFTANYANMAKDYNAKDHDAFFKLETIEVAGAQSRTVTLTRPVAQINWGTNDLDAPAITHESAYGADAANLTSKVTAKAVHTTFDMKAGQVTDDVQDVVLFEAMARPGKIDGGITPVDFAVEGYDLVSTQYLLVPATSSVVDLEWTPLCSGVEKPSAIVTGAPVQANFRTNIYGALLSAPQEFEVIKDNVWSDPDYNKEVVLATTTEEFDEAFDAGNNIVVPEGATVNLTEDKIYELENGQSIDVQGEVNTNAAYQFQLHEGKATIKGNTKTATMKNVRTRAAAIETVGDESVIRATGTGAEGRGLVRVYPGAELTLENVTLITNYNPGGWTVDVEGGTVNLINVNVICENAAVCTIPGSTVNIEGGYYFSNASSDTVNGVKRQHNYTVRIEGEGTKGSIKNATVFGVQGAVCVGYDAYCEIDGGDYTSGPLGEFKNSHYALYVFTNGITVVNDGKFKSTKHAVFNGNNDTTSEFAAEINLRGGFYSEKGVYEQEKQTLFFDLEEGYEYVETGDADYLWKIVKK